MKTPTIEQIRLMKWHGNHMQDATNMNRIHVYMTSDAPMAGKIEALTILGRDGMGIDEEVTTQAVEEYIAMGDDR